MREIKFRAKYVYADQSIGEWEYFSVWGNNDINDYDEKTLGQYTGLKDKNGKEIYEGDRVKGTHDGVIVYEEDFSSFMVECEWNKNQYMFNLGCDVAVKSKVIGNIYENPELCQT